MKFDVGEFPHGAPCWLDLLTSDPTTTAAFYCDLFGWTVREGDDSTGGYSMFMLDDRPIAGISQKPDTLDVPSQWTSYLAVDDIDDTVLAFAEFGGNPWGDPAPLGTLARTVIGTDPGGAIFGLWEAGTMPGYGSINGESTPAWNELMTRDYAGSRVFYSHVFDHLFREEGGDIGGEEAVFCTAYSSDFNPAYAMGYLDETGPSDVPTHWMPYFAVGHVVSAAGKALGLQARLLGGPYETPYGISAVFRGLEGETFGVLSPHED